MKIRYPSTTTKHGPSYQIASGIRVSLSEFGTWEVFLMRGGQRNRKSFGRGQEGLEQALQFAEDLRGELNRLEKPPAFDVEPLPPCVEGERRMMDVADDWLKLNKTRWAETTEERYYGIVRDFVCSGIGKQPINKIDRPMVKAALVGFAESKSHKTVELIHCVFSGIFNEAIEMKLIAENPAEGLLKKILPPKRKRTQKRPDPFARADRDWFLEAAQKMLPDPYPIIFRVLAFSGMRLGEVLAMKVDGLDPVNNMYRVEESLRRRRIGLPKAGVRIIDLPESLTKELAFRIKQLRLDAMQTRKPVNRFFSGISQKNVQDAMRRVCLRAGLRPRTPHALRHTYATLLLMAHVSPAYVQKQLGHHSITMTVDIYGHWIPGEGKVDLEKICGIQPVTERRKMDT